MGPSTATFALRGGDRSGAVAALNALGFQIDATRSVRSTLLDTFDGRLHRAGLRLELRESDGYELVLGGADVVAVHLRVPFPPRFADDLPVGPLRDRLSTIVGVRAVQPQVQIDALMTALSLRDSTDKTIVTATRYDHLVLVGRDVDGVPTETLEVHGVIGFRKPLRRTIDALERLGLHRLHGDTLTTVADIAGVELAGWLDSPTVPLDPAMPAIAGFREVLANLANTIDMNWQGTIDQLDPEFLHDLRIAVRRTRAVVGQGKTVLPPDIVTETREGFARLGALTAPARDLDVYLIEWNGYVRPLGADAMVALAPVHAILEQRLAVAHATLEAGLKSTAASELMTTWHDRLDSLDRLGTIEPASPAGHELGGPHAQRPLELVVAKRITAAHARLVERGRLIQPSTPASHVHDLRKDAKKLRYLIECFGSILPSAPRKKFVSRLKALQNNLGEHQDAEVHLAMIREIAGQLHARGVSADTMLAIGQLSERLERVRIAARAEFVEQFAAYDTPRTQRALDVTLDPLEQ